MSKAKMDTKTMEQTLKEHALRDLCLESRWLANSNLEELRLFLDTTEEFIEAEEKRAIESLEPHATHPDFWAENYPWEWQQIIGSQLRYAYLGSLLAATEYHLRQVCRNAAQITNSKIKADDLKGSHLEQARKYLGSVVGFSAPSARAWEVVGDLYVLRNVIVHNGGEVDREGSKKRLESLAKRSPGLTMHHNVHINKDFVIFAHNAIKAFFDELFSEQTKLHLKALNSKV